MSIAVRLEKLRFLTDELQLARYLTQHAPDDFVARTLARHIALRAENFIEHARGLRKPLNQAAFNPRTFHESKEIYATTFEEYFPIVRDKMTAHVQDFDFGKRIELWNELERARTGYFVDGAAEIDDGLAALTIPGYMQRVEPSELKDAELTKVLMAFNKSGVPGRWAQIGLDPLAMTRPNASSILTGSALHSRAGQLALIRRWIKVQRDLIARVKGYGNMVRILKARIVTDVVSFHDCLVTRVVPAGSPQQMDGLDTLLVKLGKRSAAMDQFLQVAEVDSKLLPARSVRDRVGAHLEIDDAIPLATLLQEIDTFDVGSCLGFFDRLAELFDKVCHEVLVLRMYVADGQELQGITPSSLSWVPFDDLNPAPSAVQPPTLDLNDAASYQNHLTQWLTGDESPRLNARYYFYRAFLNSQAVEQITEVNEFPGGSRPMHHTFRKAHGFILDALLSASSEDVFAKLIELIVACKQGDPYMLAETLIRYSSSATLQQNVTICLALGQLASPHKTVHDFLMKHTGIEQEWSLQFQAVLALFKIYVRTEGLMRMNTKSPVQSYANDVAPLIAGMPEGQRLLCLIAFASQFCSPELGNYAKVLAAEYNALKSEIDALCKGDLLAPLCTPVATDLGNLVQAQDYVGVCLLLADQSGAANMEGLADALLTAACRSWVVAAQHNQAACNLAVCFLRKSDFAVAVEIADHLATRNPNDVTLQIFAARVLASKPGTRDEALQRIATMKTEYKLTPAQQAILLDFEQHLANLAA